MVNFMKCQMPKFIFEKLRKFYRRYEKYLIPAALTFGFITDAFTFRVIGIGNMVYVFLAHLIFVGLNIGAINYFKENPPIKRVGYYWQFLAPLLVQFSFGNLFNGFLIFYLQSGSFFASWPFLLMLVFLIIGNETARRHDITPLIQISVYFFSIFAYLNLALPYIFKSLGVAVFLLSGLLSLGAGSGFIYFLSFLSRTTKKKKKRLWLACGCVFLLMNILYFANLIPPIPLSLKEVGVYHNVQRLDGNYKVLAEKCQNWDRCLFTRDRIHVSGERQPVYVFSAIHAPLGMSLKVAHEWKKYNPKKDAWVQKIRLPYEIKGGRKGGYRLYTYYQVTPGYWQVTIETNRGQVVGRKNFYVIKDETTPELIEKIK